MSGMWDTLYDAVREADHCQSLTTEAIDSEIESPDWEAGGRVHNWRNHVDNAVISVWLHLPLEAKLVAYIEACKASSNEEWE